MKKVGLNLVLVSLSFSFIFLMTRLSGLSLLIYFIFFIFLYFIEIFSYKFSKKLIINEALFLGKLKSLFSGKFLSVLGSLFLAILFASSFVFNTIAITKFELFFVSFLMPIVFLIVKFGVLNLTKDGLKQHEILSKRVVVLGASFISTLLFGLLNLALYQKLNLGFFEYLGAQNPNRVFKFSILNELYTYSFYLNSAFVWLQSELLGQYKFIGLALISLNKFLYFVSINYLISLFFYANRAKTGYFLNTLFLLTYVVVVFLSASSLNLASQKQSSSKSEQIIQLIIKNGSKIELSLSEFLKLEKDLNSTKELNLATTKDEISTFIDESYDKGARFFASKMADFRYSVWSDYLLLWHGAIDRNSTKFIEEKISGFIKESFDENLSQNLANLIDKSIKNYEKELFANLKNSVNLDLNLSFYDITYHENRVKISGYSTLGSALITKILLKIGAKTSTKFSASLAGAGSGAVCGPAAIICIPAFAVGSWFGVDYLFAKGDEKLTRDEFELEIYNSIMQNKDEIKFQIFNEMDEIYKEILNSLYKNKP